MTEHRYTTEVQGNTIIVKVTVDGWNGEHSETFDSTPSDIDSIVHEYGMVEEAIADAELRKYKSDTTPF